MFEEVSRQFGFDSTSFAGRRMFTVSLMSRLWCQSCFSPVTVQSIGKRAETKVNSITKLKPLSFLSTDLMGLSGSSDGPVLN